MSYNIHLAKCGELVAHKTRQTDCIVVLARILTTGDYVDMNGTKVVVNEDTLTRLVNSYNTKVELEYNKHISLIQENKDTLDPILVAESLQKSIDEFDYLPNQIDHDVSTVKSTVGNVMGKMQLRRSGGKLAIFADIRVKGEDNVAPVADNRWRNLSVQYNPTTYDWVEVSWVLYGADPDANKILSTPTMLSQPVANAQIPHYELLQDVKKYVNLLDCKILIEQRLLKLCKTRQLTKADAYFIEKNLADIKDVTVLSKMFNILDMQLNRPTPKERFIQVERAEMQRLQNILHEHTTI